MNCIKCGFSKVQPIDEKKSKMYCPKCNHAWAVGKEGLDTQGSVDFQGVSQAKNLVDMMSANAKLPPAMKSAFVAQLSGAFFEQWFEGFKAGLLADIVHKGEMYDDGKTRAGSGSTDREHRDGDRDVSEQSREDSIPEQPPRKSPTSFNRIKEKVGGIDFIRPKELTPTEEQYCYIAQITSGMNGVDYVFFDGTHYDIVLKDGIRES